MAGPKGRRNFRERMRRSKGFILRPGVMYPLCKYFSIGGVSFDLPFISKRCRTQDFSPAEQREERS